MEERATKQPNDKPPMTLEMVFDVFKALRLSYYVYDSNEEALFLHKGAAISNPRKISFLFSDDLYREMLEKLSESNHSAIAGNLMRCRTPKKSNGLLDGYESALKLLTGPRGMQYINGERDHLEKRLREGCQAELYMDTFSSDDWRRKNKNPPDVSISVMKQSVDLAVAEENYDRLRHTLCMVYNQTLAGQIDKIPDVSSFFEKIGTKATLDNVLDHLTALVLIALRFFVLPEKNRAELEQERRDLDENIRYFLNHTSRFPAVNKKKEELDEELIDQLIASMHDVSSELEKAVRSKTLVIEFINRLNFSDDMRIIFCKDLLKEAMEVQRHKNDPEPERIQDRAMDYVRDY